MEKRVLLTRVETDKIFSIWYVSVWWINNEWAKSGEADEDAEFLSVNRFVRGKRRVIKPADV